MDFSIVIPVYNSIASLAILTDEIHDFFDGKNFNYEIIFVNDGSEHATYAELERLKKIPRNSLNDKVVLTVIHLEKNIGQQKAIAVGLLKANGQFALTMDDDLQHNIISLDEMLKLSEKGSDLVFGIYDDYGINGPRAWGSKIIGAFFRYKFSVLDGKRVSSFRLIHRSVYSKLNPNFSKFFYLSAELLAYSKKPENINIERRERVYGKSGYNLKKCLLIGAKLTLYYGIIPKRWQSVKETNHYEKVADCRRR